MSSAAASRAAGFSLSTYQSLKESVSQLKDEQTRSTRRSQMAQESSSAEVLRVQQAYEEKLTACKQEIANLHQQLAERTERSSKLRLQLDREKKNAGVQQDKLQKLVQQLHDDHDKDIADLKARHAADLQDLQQQLASAAVKHEAEKQKLRDDHEDTMQELDDWCKGEIEAVRHHAAKDVDEARADADKWKALHLEGQDRNSTAMKQLQGLQRQLAEAQLQSEDLAKQVESLQQELHRGGCDRTQLLDQWQSERELQQERLKSAAMQQAAQLQELKAMRVVEMDQVQTKLKQIIGKKDTVIAALRSELDAARAHGQHVAQLLQEQQKELLGADELWGHSGHVPLAAGSQLCQSHC